MNKIMTAMVMVINVIIFVMACFFIPHSLWELCQLKDVLVNIGGFLIWSAIAVRISSDWIESYKQSKRK